MPVYVYECKKCKQEIEVEQRITEDPITHHKHQKLNGSGVCNGKLKRLIVGGTFCLKGGGWTPKFHG